MAVNTHTAAVDLAASEEGELECLGRNAAIAYGLADSLQRLHRLANDERRMVPGFTVRGGRVIAIDVIADRLN